MIRKETLLGLWMCLGTLPLPSMLWATSTSGPLRLSRARTLLTCHFIWKTWILEAQNTRIYCSKSLVPLVLTSKEPNTISKTLAPTSSTIPWPWKETMFFYFPLPFCYNNCFWREIVKIINMKVLHNPIFFYFFPSFGKGQIHLGYNKILGEQWIR